MWVERVLNSTIRTLIGLNFSYSLHQVLCILSSSEYNQRDNLDDIVTERVPQDNCVGLNRDQIFLPTSTIILRLTLTRM